MFTFSINVLLLCVVVCNVLNVGISQEDYWKQCDKKGIHFYEELGCTAVKNNGSVCPAVYKCLPYVVPLGRCLHYGKELKNDEEANGSYCNKGCICYADSNKKGEFSCNLVIDCYFGNYPPGCYSASELGSCCGSMYCPNNTEVFKCNVDGQTYREGEQFSPKDTCWNCVCKKGFVGKYEKPFCMRRPCDMELKYSKELEKHCAPVYRKVVGADKSICCPYDFLCPHEIISKILQKKGMEGTGTHCGFGEQDYNVGDIAEFVYKRNKYETKSTCECSIPPYLSCIHN